MVATLRVEKVVYDPSIPTVTNNLASIGHTVLYNIPAMIPRTSDPLVLTANVPINDEAGVPTKSYVDTRRRWRRPFCGGPDP